MSGTRFFPRMELVQEYNKFTEQIQKKAMTKFSNKFKKPYFWPIFPFFESGSVTHNNI